MTERGLRAGSRRRIVAAIAMAVLAVGALGACRSDAGSAAFVGSTRFTDAQVSTAVSQMTTTGLGGTSQAKSQLVLYLVYNEVAQRFAADNKIDLPKPTEDQISTLATQYSTAQTNLFVTAEAQAAAWTQALAAKATPVTPTDAQLQPIFQRAVAAKLATPDGFADFKKNILAVPDFTAYFGLEQAMQKSEANENISINPRYAATCTATPCPQLAYPMQQLQNQQGAVFNAVVLPLGPIVTAPAVIDQTASHS